MFEHSDPVDRPFLSEYVQAKARQASVSEIAVCLERVLSRRLTVYICGVSEGMVVRQWASAEVTDVSSEINQRLRTAYEITLLLLQFDGAETVRAWFIGMNPKLENKSPSEAIRTGRGGDAMYAARAFIAHG